MALLLGGCASQQTIATSRPNDLLDAFIDALNRADLEAVGSLFAPDATAFFPLDSSPREALGKDAIRNVFRSFFDELRQKQAGPLYMHIIPKHVLVQPTRHGAIVTFEAGSGPVTSRRTVVLEHAPSGWRILHLHASNIRLSTTGAGP